MLMKHLIFILFFTCPFSIPAQITYSPIPLSMTVNPDSLGILDINFTNTQDTAYTIYWKMIKDSTTYNTEWDIFMCDLNLCYAPNILMNAPNKPNLFGSNANAKFQFHFQPNNVSGCTIVGLKLYTDKNFTQEVLYTCININNCVNNCASSVKDQPKNLEINVFPNPAIDYFEIKNDEVIKKIIIYNLFGTEVKSYLHYDKAQHDITMLKSGMYVLKCLDINNKTIKTIKLQKVFGGA